MLHRIARLSVLFFAACFGLTSGAAPAPAPDGQAFVIRLARPAKVGDTAWFVADTTVVKSVQGNLSGHDRSLKPTSVAIHFEATERIEAVGARGEPTRATYRVAKCVARFEKGQDVLLQPGTVLTVEAGKWKSSIRADRGYFSVYREIALRPIVSLPNLGDVSDDDVFGSREPRKVGESWAADPAALAKWVSREGAAVDKNSVSGTIKLKGLQTVNGVQCLVVTGRAVTEPWVPDPKDMPEDMRLVSGRDEYKFTRLVPVDPSTGLCPLDSSSNRGSLKVRTDEKAIEGDLLMDVKQLKTVGIKRTPGGGPAVARGAE
jgi:hypothetical protein